MEKEITTFLEFFRFKYPLAGTEIRETIFRCMDRIFPNPSNGSSNGRTRRLPAKGRKGIESIRSDRNDDEESLDEKEASSSEDDQQITSDNEEANSSDEASDYNEDVRPGSTRSTTRSQSNKRKIPEKVLASTIADSVYEVLMEADTPLRVEKIHARMKEKGLRGSNATSMRDQLSVICQRATQCKRFILVSPRTFAIKNRKYTAKFEDVSSSDEDEREENDIDDREDDSRRNHKRRNRDGVTDEEIKDEIKEEEMDNIPHRSLSVSLDGLHKSESIPDEPITPTTSHNTTEENQNYDAASDVDPMNPPSHDERPSDGNDFATEVMKGAIDLLKSENRPMRSNEIYDVLASKGRLLVCDPDLKDIHCRRQSRPLVARMHCTR
eukprot:TRINITY_DN3409_c0_g1_i4.p1 TRINITY_DN3409_c0_g1~~TRINITY_DN3409_c0_g1_i4.p1  ORF type:complete len:382 (+),score=56.92 TRINITY_DN3409_c0_g1_i4:71-1216(+)